MPKLTAIAKTRISGPMDAELRALATRIDRTPAEVIRYAIADYLKRHDATSESWRHGR